MFLAVMDAFERKISRKIFEFGGRAGEILRTQGRRREGAEMDERYGTVRYRTSYRPTDPTDRKSMIRTVTFVSSLGTVQYCKMYCRSMDGHLYFPFFLPFVRRCPAGGWMEHPIYRYLSSPSFTVSM